MDGTEHQEKGCKRTYSDSLQMVEQKDQIPIKRFKVTLQQMLQRSPIRYFALEA
jgi:hypothetical protein